MWNPGAHIHEPNISSTEKLAAVTGDLDDEAAQAWFAGFCRSSFYFTIKLLTGKSIDPYQEIKLRSFFLRDFCVNIEGRGIGKSWTICHYIILYALFNPGCKIGICSGTFRQSKLIFKQIEKFANHPDGKFLKQCIPPKSIKHDPDGYEMTIGSSTIEALPLTEKIRGKRFHKVIIDEYLLVPKEIIANVIRPFLTAKQEPTPDEEKIIKMEEELISRGQIKESDRYRFPGNSIIGLSSACYKFEDLYKDVYLPYIDRINDPKAEGVNHCIFKLSYEAVKDNGRIDTKLIEEGRATSSRAQFDREYRAIFSDESGGFYNYLSILEATVPPDSQPMIKLKGDPNKKYILAIDPNASESETADHFAMCLMELDEEKKSGTLVHAYATVGRKTSKKSQYLDYLMKNFKIVYVIVDNAGGPSFLSTAEEFLGGFHYPLIRFEDTFDGTEEGIRLAKKSYNSGLGRIVHSQVFSKGNWIREANENLQYQIEHRKILFGGRIGDKGTETARQHNIPIDDLEFSSTCDTSGMVKTMDFIDHLNEMVDLTKKELTLIEVKSSASGQQTFDLPSNVKDAKNPGRARRDLYTALLLGAHGCRCYFDIHSDKVEVESIFMPSFIG